MGAYSNPPVIKYEPTGVGKMWANAIAQAGKDFGTAIADRQKRLREAAEKENAELVAIGKQRAQLAQQGVKVLEQNLAKMPNLAGELRDAYIKEFNQGWKIYTQSQVARTPEELAALEPALNKFQSFQATGKDQLMAANEIYQSYTLNLDQIVKGEVAAPGGVDWFDSRNNDLVKAANIENGGITDGEKRNVYINDKGQTIVEYTSQDGKSFEINLSAPREIATVPDLNNIFEGAISKTGIFVGEGKERTISQDYLPIDPATGQPKMSRTTQLTRYADGKQRLVISEGPDINMEGIGDVYAKQVNMLNLTDDQKVSIWKNILVPQMGLGKEEQEAMMAKLSYNPNGETIFESDSKEAKLFNEAIVNWATEKAGQDAAAVTSRLGGGTKTINISEDKQSNQFKNLAAGLKRLEQTDQLGGTVAISGPNSFIQKVDGGYQIFNVNADKRKVPLFSDSEGNAKPVSLQKVISLLGIDQEALAKQVGVDMTEVDQSFNSGIKD